jgi:opacity protein-like surface antigen
MIDIKRALLTAAAAAALGNIPVLAVAQGFGSAYWYGKAFGGFTFPQANELDVEGNDPDLDYDNGYTVGAALGYGTTNWGLELEYAYRDSEVEIDDIGGRDVGDDASANAIMLNALYKFGGMGASGAITPYLGGGLGVASLDVGDFGSDGLFAYQFLGGADYAFNPNVSVFGELRYFATEDAELGGPGNLDASSSLETIDLLFGVNYRF